MTVDVNLTNAMLLLLGLAGIEAMRLFVGFAFRRFTKPGFVTLEHCKGCGGGFNDEIVVIKKVVLMIAIKNGIKEEDLQNLVLRGRPS